jgi:hypothetical protein
MKMSLPRSPYIIQRALDRKENSDRYNGMNSTLFVAMTRFCNRRRSVQKILGLEDLTDRRRQMLSEWKITHDR